MTYLFLNTSYKVGSIIIPVCRWGNEGPERLSDLSNLPKVTQLEEGRAGVKPGKFGPWVCALNHHIISTVSPGCQFLYLCCWCNNKGTCGDMVRIWGNVHPGPCRVPGTPEWLGKWRLWSSPSLSLQPIPECPGPSYVHTDKSERKQSPRRKQGWGRALEASRTARCKFTPPCLLIGSPWANHLTSVKFPKGSNGRNNIYILGLLRRLNVEMYLALCQAQQKLREAGLLMLLSFPGRRCLALHGKEVSLTPGDYWDSAVTWGWPPEEIRPWNPHSPPSPNHFLHPLSKFPPPHSIPLMLSGEFPAAVTSGSYLSVRLSGVGVEWWFQGVQFALFVCGHDDIWVVQCTTCAFTPGSHGGMEGSHGVLSLVDFILQEQVYKDPKSGRRMFTRRLAFLAILGVIGRFSINPPLASLHRYNCTEPLYQRI